MKGSEKQVKWAEDIKARFADDLNTLKAKVLEDKKPAFQKK